jgi:phage portal protein BeeE
MKFKNPFTRETKASKAQALLVTFGANEAKFTPRDYASLADEGFRKNVIVNRCIKLVAQNAAGVPWAVFRGRGEAKERLHDHPLLDLLRQPNPLQGGAELFEAIYGFFLIAGNSYIECAGPRGLPPLELWTLRPDRMRVVPAQGDCPRPTAILWMAKRRNSASMR